MVVIAVMYFGLDRTNKKALLEPQSLPSVERARRDTEEYHPKDFKPYDVELGQGIFVINDKLGQPSFSIPREKGYLGKPSIDCWYACGGENYYRIMYYAGNSVSGGKVSKRLFDKAQEESAWR
jgi:hypothetical protein